MAKAINPGDRVEVVGGFMDGLRGTLMTGRPLDLLANNESMGRLIVIKGDDEKAYPMPVHSFEELRVIDEP